MRHNRLYTISETLRVAFLGALLLTSVTAAGSGVVVRGSVYGGGNAADVMDSTFVNISTGQILGNVYGGGNLGDVGRIVKDSINYNYKWADTADSDYNNTGVCTVNITGGTIGTDSTATENHGNVFGGGKGQGDTFWCEKGMAYKTSVSISDGTVWRNVYGGGQVGRVENDTEVTLSDGAEIKGDVFGAGAGLNTHGYSALVRGNTTVTIQGDATVGENVYGGGETASLGRFNVVGGSPTTPAGGGGSSVTIQGSAQIGGDVFGAGKGVEPDTTYTYADKAHMPYRMMAKSMGSFTAADSAYWTEVDAKNVLEYFATETIYRDFLRTLALASTPTVTIGGTATIAGSVYGGGEVGITLGTVTVSMTGGTVAHDVYGGGALADTNTGNWNLNNYEEDGDSLQAQAGEVITDLFTRTGTAPNYTYKRVIDENAEVGSGDYFRRVPTWADATQKSKVFTTNVSLTGGTITGDVYGGGLGDAAHAALVYGDVTVNIGSGTLDAEGFASSTSGEATIGGNVFGCNNFNGTPKGSVHVNIYQTGHTEADTSPSGINTIAKLDSLFNTVSDYNSTDYLSRFALSSVYGGGNLAAYSPTEDTDTATVHVYTCDNTIHTLYGGGNAADATNVKTIIDGGFFDRVFGGGNGYSATNNHTNPQQANYNPGANISGSATTEIHGGLYRQAFGGSNQYGNVNKASLSVTNDSPCELLLINESFGGANEADITGDVETTLACSSNPISIGTFYGGSNKADIIGNVTLNVEGGDFLNVFGGSKGTVAPTEASDSLKALASADISGNVTLNLYGGTMNNAFGGSDVNGNIGGKITVNMLDRGGTCTLTVHNIYGGGRDAAYRPDTIGAFPEVNILNGRVSKKSDGTGGMVFGGGLGATATVASSPLVIIGDTATAHADYVAVVDSIVFGGGDAAAVEGNTSVILQKGNSRVGRLFGGGNAADVSDSTAVTVTGGTVAAAVYGGCNASGTVEKASTVTVTGGTIGTAFADTTTIGYIPNVLFGGGKGAATVTGNVTLNVGTKTVTGEGQSAVTTYAGRAKIYGNVYGGSENGEVSDVEVFLYGDSIHGNVFGGGYATASGKEAADTVNVVLDGTYFDRTNNNTAQIFGCNNKIGTPTSLVTVHVKRTVGSEKDEDTPVSDRNTYDVAAIYGGGNQADYRPTGQADSTNVIIEGCDLTSIEYVYGGGNAAAVPASGVTIKGTYIIDKVFGGGNGAGEGNPGANVGTYIVGTDSIQYGTGKAVTKLIGGTINSVFGGSNTLGDVREIIVETAEGEPGDSTPLCCDSLKVGYIYGAGSQADVSGDVNVILECLPEAYVDAVYGGANNANINGNVSLTVTSGKFGRVFGGNNSGGSINGTITVVAKEEGCKPLEIGELYGGGNQAPYSKYGCTYNETTQKWTANTEETEGAVDHTEGADYAIDVLVESCTTIGKVFGGGNEAEVIGNTHVEINMFHGTTEDAPTILRPIGKIGQVFGGGNQAKVIGNTTVDIGTDGETTNNNNEVEDGQKKGVNIVSGANLYLDPEHDVRLDTLTAGIYGGGNAADVIGNTEVNIGTAEQSEGINIAGDIFGGGYGETTTVTGKVTVNIGAIDTTAVSPTYVGYANISGDVYGGSAKGKVNATKGENSTYTASDDSTRVNLYGGTITGNVYGGGLGDNTYAADVYGPVTVTVYDGAAYNVYGCNNVNGAPQDTVVVNVVGGTVNNSVFGGGNQANYGGSPGVNIMGGTVTNSVFGGGDNADVVNTHVAISDSIGKNTFVGGNVYGGGNLGDVGRINKDTLKSYKWTDAEIDASNYDRFAWNETGVCTVIITGGTIGTESTASEDHGNVFGGGKGQGDTFWCEKGMAYKTNVSISQGTVWHNVYGGGQVGRVENDTEVTVGAESGSDEVNVKGDVFGAGAGLDTHGYSALVRGNPTVTIQGGAKVENNVYGGGEIASVGKHLLVTEDNKNEHPGLAVGMPYTLDNTNVGICRVTVKDGAEIAGSVFGAGKGLNPDSIAHPGRMQLAGVMEYYFNRDSLLIYVQTLALATETHVTIGGETGTTKVKGSVYGGSESGFVQYHTDVQTLGNCEIGTGTTGADVFGGGLGIEGNAAAGRVGGNTKVTIGGGTTYGSVYGGGAYGIVKENVEVNVTGGEVKEDVYGGGALANTNTANWDAETGTWATGMNGANDSTVYKTVVNLTGGKIGNAYGGGLGRAAVTAREAVCYTQEECDAYNSSLTGFVTTSDTNPDTSTNYTQEEANAHNAALEGARKTTDVKLPAISAQDEVSEVQAMVYGDVTVTVDGTVLHQESDLDKQQVSYTETENGQVKTVTARVTKYGRVFGANNVNGTPKGHVLVHVKQTVPEDGGDHEYDHFEIHSVYGGGNMANYLPASESKSTHVLIEDCGVTSIQYVYGGGNSASVPKTDVTVEGCFEIGMIFGGGNGEDPVQDASGVWVANPGADVIKNNIPGTGTITAHGGTIRWLYGGSNKKGVCGSITENLESTNEDCPLKITNVYGAGKNADVQEVFIVAKCPGENVEYLYGGSYNANIQNGITLTLIGGQYKNVFGGNDSGGTIGGPIKVNIQETLDCAPIVIDNLYGGGNRAEYPGNSGTGGSITVNVKSCTHIGNIYGGGKGEGAVVNGNTAVNINMEKGLWASKNNVPVPIYIDNMDTTATATSAQIKAAIEAEIPNIVVDASTIDKKTKKVTCTVKDELGTIGNVYGGGDEATVNGWTMVNICTAKTDSIMKHDSDGVPVDASDDPVFDEEGKLKEGKTYNDIAYDRVQVLGTRIIGDVYGGGNLADVSDNTYVNICAKEDESTHVYGSVAFKADSVTIGGSVFGGGKGVANSFTCEKAMVGIADTNEGQGSAGKGTSVWIGNGTIGGSVYGGGEVGRVEFDTKVTIGFGDGTGGSAKSPIIRGDVYGAGMGVDTHGYSGLVRGNSFVTIEGDSKVGRSVFGAGQMASLGRYWIATSPADTAAHHVELGMPYGLKSGGKSIVTIRGYAEIGPDTIMKMPTFDGNVFGAGKGILPYVDVSDPVKGPGRYYMKGGVYTWESYAHESMETAYCKYTNTLAITDSSIVIIGGNAFIKGSVYGGSQNGHVRQSTYVKIEGGQIGHGKNQNRRYSETEWTSTSLDECASWEFDKDSGAPYDKFATKLVDGKYCYENGEYAEGAAPVAKDGHTFYGNVFGGGSGAFPYKPGKWHRDAGAVGGNTKVEITGGHILTSVYGGNELTDVLGDSCIVLMSGGTLGVPRSLAQITAHPVTCYLFGAGKGDQRVFFNTWTNVKNATVVVSDSARIFGSVFGGGEDGHILENASVTIKNNAKIGTTGTSYVDGNIFGGGRGFSGDALTAGTVGGNVDLNIEGGTMLGSIYGGGRLASVGMFFTDPNNPIYGQFQEDSDSKTHGHITINISGGTIGNDTLTSNSPGVEHSGNVFGGSMGRLTLLNGTTLNPLWPELAQAKTADINITGNGTTITRNVYGGGEVGTVREDTYVTIGGTRDAATGDITASGTPTIGGSVFGGGYGSDIYNDTTTVKVYWGDVTAYYAYTPMQWAGCVGGNSHVNVMGGAIGQNVYGGGEMASVGIIDYSLKTDNGGPFTHENQKYSYNSVKKHDSQTSDGKTFFDFGLSWPYELKYVPCTPEPGDTARGVTTVNVVDGTIGGYVYGAGKGKVDFSALDSITKQRYVEAFCANVRKANVTIGTSGGSGDTPKIMRSVYGGGEDGHVYEDATVTIHHGTIANSVFGGGKGEGKFKTVLWNLNNENVTDSAYSWTAGRVYGNTTVTMNGGSVGMFVYGGGNKGSVGKGSYAGGYDDYSTAGYGELPELSPGSNNVNQSKLWHTASTATSETKDMAYHFLNSGIATLNLYGGTVGSDTAAVLFEPTDKLPYGSVFGGSRGKAAMDVGQLSPRYRYVPDFFLGYVNKAVINVGDTSATATGNGPKIYGSIYGGGQDGHVRNSTEVRLFKGEVAGHEVDAAGRSGHVFGAGSGIGTYKDGNKNKVSYSSGSVTCTTLIEVYNDAEIKGNIYGGGAMATVGPPQTGQGFDEYNDTASVYAKDGRRHGSMSYTKIDVKGGKIGGSIFAASRGPSDAFLAERFTSIQEPYDSSKFATDLWSEAIIRGGTIDGSVYGGGETGLVRCGVIVNILGGTIKNDVYGGGALAHTNTGVMKQDRSTHQWGWTDVQKTTGKYTTTVNLLGGTIFGDAYGGGLGRKEYGSPGQTGYVSPVEAKVFGDVKVNLNGVENVDSASVLGEQGVRSRMLKLQNNNYQLNTTERGAVVSRVFGCNNLNGSPQGKVRVHVFATQPAGAGKTIKEADKYAKFGKLSDYTIDNYSGLVTIAGEMGYDVSAYTNNIAGQTNDSLKLVALNVMKDSIANRKYDVRAVYGGGDLAAYTPMGPTLGTDANNNYVDNYMLTQQRTEVVIDGCELTSIRQVYGGGNAASVPATYLEVNGTYEIDEAFGGGNGADNYTLAESDGIRWYQNPGANVGYKNFTTVNKNAAGYDGTTDAKAYRAVDNQDASTPEMRKRNYRYGDESTAGRAETKINGGKIHVVYGGSNKKGNISTIALSQYEGASDCPMDVDETYGAGKDAPIDGIVDMRLKCAKGVKEMYGGAKNADVNSDVVLNITNGSSLERVFGGNHTSGAISGSITVNVEEGGCEPIHIGELYAGGYLAPYSIYGYESDGRGGYKTDTIDYGGSIGTVIQRIPITKKDWETSVKPVYEQYMANDLDKLGLSGITDPTEEQIAAKVAENPSLERFAIEYYTIKGTLASLPKKDPRINVVSATRIDTIYGGGYRALVIGSPHVNVNMTNGKVEVTETDGEYKDASGNVYNPDSVDENLVATLPIGTIGHIFGGGNLADVYGDTYVEIGTGEWLNSEGQREMLGTAEINNKDTTMTFTYDDTQEKWTYERKSSVTDPETGAVTVTTDTVAIVGTPTPARREATITGNVFGGGRGVADNFFCDKAMVGIDGEGADESNPDKDKGGTSVTIANGTVKGSVYGGGEIARVEKNTVVTIGLEEDTGEPIVEGDVYGAGKGVDTHGYSALVRGNPTVIVQGKAKVGHSVYGGGQTASVARYKVVNGVPVALANSTSGNCKVIVRGEAEIGPDSMVMTKPGGPDDTGYVFGAGRGVMPGDSTYVDLAHSPKHMVLRGSAHTDALKNKTWTYVYPDDPTNNNIWEYFLNDSAYHEYIKTLALSSKTDVTIGGHAFVKGSVYGGSENGLVQYDTNVTIQDSCQIGNGYVQMNEDGTPLATPLSMDRRYTAQEWREGRLIVGENDRQALKDLKESYPQLYQHSLPECASWPYGQVVGDKKIIYASYDKFANAGGYYDDDNTQSAGGGMPTGSDGRTFYGNVFGGGSGYFPYAPGKWYRDAGLVRGSAHVTITGGHILTNVYGGNELTDVEDTCFVKMTGGTLGVPRTLAQIAAHPVTCYLFGAGKGDPRPEFNEFTTVGDVIMEISGDTIYGSVFGGAEDGHVARNVTMDIKPGIKIGTWGTSYVDGNVFGGGRGFAGESLTAGNVGDSVTINISGGRMLGSVYGGGRLGSVGYDINATETSGQGVMSERPGSGHVVINISGGTIGNDYEYAYIAPEATDEQVTAAKAVMPNTLHDSNHQLLHTKGGNVFAGGMGRFYLLDDSTVISHWYDLGKVKSTRLTISDSARIKSNVYGGCELGWVSGKHVADTTFANVDSLSTEILITGGIIGTEVVDEDSIPRYTFGSVYGGGRGDTMEKLYKEEVGNIVSDNPKFYAGRVVGSTRVEMQDGLVLGSVYGGGQVGNVGMASTYGEVADKTVSSNVIVSGGTIGRDTVMVGDECIRFGGSTMGNVYGAGSGDRTIVRCGLVLGNANVSISQAEGKTTRIYHNVYGGGAYGTVGDFNYVTAIDPTTQTIKVSQVEDLATDSTGIARVTITGGEIGIDGHNNGMVFGSSRGDVSGSYKRDDYMAWAYDTNVNIGNDRGGFGPTEPRIHGSIYGGGENGHVLRNADVEILSGYVGDSLSYYAYRGNVYGAGCGTDTIMIGGKQRYKPLAGVVRGNTLVNIYDGLITGGVYGAGAMAYVGTVKNDTTLTQYRHTNDKTSFALSWPYEFEFVDTTGTATINITGGHIGIKGTDGGDVYGSARGEAGDRYITAHHAYVKDAFININLPRTASPAALDSTGVSCITGSVHGSGEDGYVYGDAHITIEKGLIGHSVYGAGKGKGTYKMRLPRFDKVGSTNSADSVTTDIYSLISGRVMGNTYVTMNDGHVIRNIYGGGNMGSVGKGNYAGGPDDYFQNGYGELPTGNLWDSVSVDSKAFLGSGKATVKVLGGTVGNPDKLKEFKEGLPLGNVFGGSRGLAAPNVPSTLSPRYHYCPTFFSGYVNESDVTIGTDSTAGPRILCSVYGGAQDGHVRRWTNVKVNSGTIGLPFTVENKSLMGKDNINDSLWLYRGNVYGAGSGISEFKYDFNGDGDYDDQWDITTNGRTTTYTEKGYSTSAGSVTCFTKVDIKGGTIYRNVAGGGSLASVGPLKLPTMAEYAAIKVDTDTANWGKQSLNEVIIGGKTEGGKLLKPVIGTREGVLAGYGGNVFGGSRGEADRGSGFATSVWTKVYVKDGATILGNVFGGGNAGEVYKDTDVQIGEPKSE